MRSLGLQNWKNVEVICNLESGGCNPYAIEELLKAGFEVRSHRRLHAKIYIFNERVIIGSSNVSSNGLMETISEAKGWVEANVLSDERLLVDRARSLFRQLWTKKPTKVVELDSEFLADAKNAWDSRPHVGPTTTAKTLLAACKEWPQLFASVFLAIYTEDLSPKANEKMRALKTTNAAKKPLDVADLQKAWGYQFPINPGSWIVDFDCRRKKGKIWGCARVQNPATILNVAGEDNLVIAIRGSVRPAGSDRAYKLGAREKALLEANSETLRELAGDRTLLPLTEALDHIAL
ncbi:phospholipase D family protein [Bradyrhizobium sp. NAS96.2]|uniref:phospholipase D-like domain-containing protein n=1 Tax=Bradyrhizobium sp. NAS96.2 TaxID=1680160 RepID=UPI00143E02F5